MIPPQIQVTQRCPDGELRPCWVSPQPADAPRAELSGVVSIRINAEMRSPEEVGEVIAALSSLAAATGNGGRDGGDRLVASLAAIARGLEEYEGVKSS